MKPIGVYMDLEKEQLVKRLYSNTQRLDSIPDDAQLCRLWDGLWI